VFEGHDIDAGVEGAGAKGQGGQIAYDIEARVIPARIADGEVERDIAMTFEVAGMRAFSGSAIEHARTGWKITGEIGEIGVDHSLKVKDEAAQKRREKALQARVIQAAVYFRLASSMMVDPAPQAASKIVNGSAPTTKEK
jgi:hypothetical protein